jgi:protein-S-isoprenylcysteine O-methyltransferase Ste14
MDMTRVAVLSAAFSTWAGFGVCMRCYFRHARQAHPAKSLLTGCAFICTLAQAAALVWAGTPGALLAWGGVACFAAAQALFWWALLTHGRRRPAFAFVPVAPASLVRAGPYRLMRHPIYTAYLLAWLAGAVATGQAWLLLTVVLMGVLYARAARQEEHSFLTGSLAPQYQEYRRQTGMFLPRPGAWAVSGRR